MQFKMKCSICEGVLHLHRWTEKQQLQSHDNRWSYGESAKDPLMETYRVLEADNISCLERHTKTGHSINREEVKVKSVDGWRKIKKPFHIQHRRPSLNRNKGYSLPTYCIQPLETMWSKFHIQVMWFVIMLEQGPGPKIQINSCGKI